MYLTDLRMWENRIKCITESRINWRSLWRYTAENRHNLQPSNLIYRFITWKILTNFHKVTYMYIRMVITLKHDTHTHTHTSSSFMCEYCGVMSYQCKGENAILINAERCKAILLIYWDHSLKVFCIREPKQQQIIEIFPGACSEKCHSSFWRFEKISYFLCHALGRLYHVSLWG